MNASEPHRPDGFPEGFEIVQQLHGAGVFGEVFEVYDRRTATSEQVTRTVRFFRDPDPKWREKLLEHAQRLVTLELPYVSLPLEVGQTAAGDLYLVGQHLGSVVSALVSRHQGLDPDAWDRVAENMLEALANLHKHEITHGDVRPQNAYFEPECVARRSVWLADTAIGQLPCWSEGSQQDPESSYYRPPELKDEFSPQPTKKADLYALGLMLVECTLGAAANRQREAQPIRRAELVRQLKEAGASARLQLVIRSMLAPEAERPADAGEVLALYRKSPISARSLRSWQGAATALALMLVVVIGYSMFGDPKIVFQERITRLEQKVAGVNADLEERKSKLKEKNSEYNSLQATLDLPENIVKRKLFEADEDVKDLKNKLFEADVKVKDLKNTLVGANEDIKDLEKELFDCRGGVSDDERLARKRWKIEIGGEAPIEEPSQLTMNNLDGVSKSVLENEEYLKYFSAWDQAYDEWKAEDLDQWVRHARNDQGEVAGGREEIQELLGRLAASTVEPWSAEKRDSVTQHLANLNQARKAWDEFARSERKLTEASDYFDGESVGVPEVKGICLGWRNEFQNRKQWRLRLKKGHVKAATDTDRYVTISTDVGGYEDSEGNIKGWHEWNKNTAHEYNRGHIWSFDWKAGTSIRVQLTHKQALTGLNFDFIDQEIPGPIAIYRLHKQGRVGVDESFLTLEVIDCPGPPLKQEIADVVPGSLKQLLGN